MRKELLLGYFAQALGIISNLIIIPFILNSLGAKIFGIYSFFIVISGLVNYIDVGMSSSMIRLTKQFKSGTLDKEQLVETNNTFHSILLLLDFLFILALILLKDRILNNWELTENATLVFIFIVLAASLKFLQTLYRGSINGADKVLVLHIFSVCSIISRTFILATIIYFFKISVLELFQYLTLVSLLELVSLNLITGKYIPALKGLPYTYRFNFKRITDNFKFIGSITIGSLVWTLITQVDKFILGIVVDIEKFGLYQAGVTLASSVLLVASPITKSLLPRFIKYHEKKEFPTLYNKYLSLSSIFSLIGVFATITFIFFGEFLLNIWLSIEDNAGIHSILILFALGNAIALIGSGAYYLQFSFGDLKFYRVSNYISIGFFIILTIPAAYLHGFYGAGYAWITMNLFNLIVINSKMNYHFERSLNKRFWVTILVQIIKFTSSVLLIYFVFREIPFSPIVKFGGFLVFSTITFFYCTKEDLKHLLKE